MMHNYMAQNTLNDLNSKCFSLLDFLVGAKLGAVPH